MIARYAILLKTHYWDATVSDRINELTQAARSGDIFLFIDETSGTVEVPVEILAGVQVIRRTIADAARIGLAMVPEGGLFWYNTDYPIYLSAAELGAYDYILMLEHDCVIRVDLDRMVERARAATVDFVAAPIRATLSGWHWLPTLNGIYQPGTERGYLTCICLISRAGWMSLFARRLKLSRDYLAGALQACRLPLSEPVQAGVIESWPFAEAFMATDLELQGFRIANLSEFGSTQDYDWWPPMLASELASSDKTGFFHPVLNEGRYIGSCLRHCSEPKEWFDRRSLLRTQLDRCSQSAVVPHLAAVFRAGHQTDAMQSLRAMHSLGSWVELGLGYDACATNHPTSHSRPTDTPQWWTIDLEERLTVYRIRLAPHENPIEDADIRMVTSDNGDDWTIAGVLPRGAGASTHPPLDVHFHLARKVSHVSLMCNSAEALRTGRLEIFAER